MHHAPAHMMKNGSDCLIYRDGNLVRKVYQPWARDMHGRILRQALFMQTFGPLKLSPSLVSFTYNEISATFCEGASLNDFLDANHGRREEIMDAVCLAVFELHVRGYNHCDLTPTNILCRFDETGKISVRFVDAEYARVIPSEVSCSESFDFSGGAHWIKDHFGHPYSGRSLEQGFFPRLVRLLKARLFEVTGSQANIPDSRYIYHSFDLPGLKISLPEAQRDVPARFNKMGLDFKGKTVVDIGANIGGMSLEAAKRGAKVIGLELDASRVDAANRLARFAGLDAQFKVFDIVNDTVPQGDIVFFCAVDGYMADKDAIYRKVAGAVKETLIFESNRRDRMLPFDEWEALWRDLGFNKVISLEKSTDDVRVENHWREIFRCDVSVERAVLTRMDNPAVVVDLSEPNP